MTSPGPRPDPNLPPRPSIMHSQQKAVRRPRYVLGTFWAIFALLALIAGVTGPDKWLILIAIGLGAYSAYLYRGGRYGWFFF